MCATVTIKMSKKLLEAVEGLVREGHFRSRSESIVRLAERAEGAREASPGSFGGVGR